MKEIEKNVPLASHTTLKLGGIAEYFAVIQTLQDLEDAVIFARDNKIPFFILGGGSNVLVSDRGFPGIVFKLELKGISKVEVDGGAEIVASAGEVWDRLVEKSVEWHLFGLENLSGIPGTVGAAPIQNIGAYGVEAMDLISFVEVFDSEDLRKKIFKPSDCAFGYRDSIFKKPEGKKYIVTAVGFHLKKEDNLKTHYKDLQFYVKEHGMPETLSDMRKAILSIRAKKFPDIKKVGTAGSFFKNPIVNKDFFERLKEKFPEIPGFPTIDGKVKVSMAWILDRILKKKGYEKGSVTLYAAQPLVLVHSGGGTAEEVKKFAEEIAKEVKEKTGIEVEWEVQCVG